MFRCAWGIFPLVMLIITACQSPSAPTLVAPASTVEVPTATMAPTALTTITLTSPPATATAETVVATSIATTLAVTVTAPAVSPVITSTASVTPVATARSHTVALGETLTAIALRYDVTVQELVAANDLAEPNSISEGQTLLIPTFDEVAIPTTEPQTISVANGTLTPTPYTTTVPVSATLQPQAPNWPPSRTDGDPANYPLSRYSPFGSLLIHYQPGTYPAVTIGTLAPMLDQILFELEQSMGKSLKREVNIYLAGTLFADNPALQGLSVSRNYQTTVLVNGAFHPGEEYYILGHELTHVAATNLLGPASSTMIHEGLATYLPQKYLVQQADYLPIYEICAAAQQTNAFVPVRTLIQYGYSPNGFGGHIRTFFHYNLAGCFTGYLIERFGMEKLDTLYDSGDYYGVYGMTLEELDQAWQQWLSTIELSVDAPAFVATVEEVSEAYEEYVMASAGGYHANFDAYLLLNQARLAANQGKLDEAAATLNLFWELFRL